jgi:NAD(P)H-quinone oxidoreductase subunit 5
MSRLIGVDREWAEARAAAQFALKYFVAGSLF